MWITKYTYSSHLLICSLLLQICFSLPNPWIEERDRIIRSLQDAENQSTTEESTTIVDFEEFTTESPTLSNSNISNAALIAESSTPVESKRRKSLEDYLPPTYNQFEIPRSDYNLTLPNGTIYNVNKPVTCFVYLGVHSIHDFDETNELVTLDTEVMLIWEDGNIKKEQASTYEEAVRAIKTQKPIILTPEFLKKIWYPDIHFEDATKFTQPNFLGNSQTVIFYPVTGFFVLRSRMIVKLNCGMDFAYYPADTQNCPFIIRSFSYSKKDLQLGWMTFNNAKPGAYLYEISDPNFEFQISSTQVEDSEPSTWGKLLKTLSPGGTDESTGISTNLKFVLMARRKMSYHLIQTYFVSVFFVVVTWLAFLIPPEMFEVRIAIAMSTLLTLTAMFASVRESTPIVSYTKAIDVWMVSSILFIFLALTAFTIIAWIQRGITRLDTKLKFSQQAAATEGFSLSMLERGYRRSLGDNERKRQIRKFKWFNLIVEKFAVHILSASYVIFNIIYWSVLLTASGYLAWSVNPVLNKINKIK